MERNKIRPATGSVLELVGNTPLIEVRPFWGGKPGVTIYAKLEAFNPGGSVKDRPALRMIEEGEATGRLTRDRVILDATSGNTGVAYALIGAAKGYSVALVMPANATQERKKIVTAYGASIIESDPLLGSDGAILEARRLVAERPEKYFCPDQYNNPANWKAHYESTGPEVFRQSQGRVTHLVASIGTSGTLMGTGRWLKEQDPAIEVYAVEPEDGFHGIEGLKHMASSIVPGIYDESLLDGKFAVTTEEAYAYAEALALELGLFVGHSSGAALWGALQLSRQIEQGVIVTVFPDGGDRYLSLRR